MEKSQRTTETNLHHITAIQWPQQCTQKPSWHEKAGDVRQKILGDIKPSMTHPLKLPWIDTGTHTPQLAGKKTDIITLDHAVTI